MWKLDIILLYKYEYQDISYLFTKFKKYINNRNIQKKKTLVLLMFMKIEIDTDLKIILLDYKND